MNHQKNGFPAKKTSAFMDNPPWLFFTTFSHFSSLNHYKTVIYAYYPLLWEIGCYPLSWPIETSIYPWFRQKKKYLRETLGIKTSDPWLVNSLTQRPRHLTHAFHHVSPRHPLVAPPSRSHRRDRSTPGCHRVALWPSRGSCGSGGTGPGGRAVMVT